MVDATTKMVVPAILFAGVVAIYAMYKNAEERRINPFAPKNLLDKDMNLPVIWLYYDTSDVNARWWSDFGRRGLSFITYGLFFSECFFPGSPSI